MNDLLGNLKTEPARKYLRHAALRTGAVLAAGALLLAGAGVARADDIYNTLDGTVDTVAEVMPLNVGGANGSTLLAVVPRNGDGKSGCNLTGSAVLTLNIASSNTSVATIVTPQVSFTSCGSTPTVVVHPVAAGSATVTASVASNNSGGTFTLAPATFVVNVAPPANTAPVLTISGVAAGASYAKGSVPAAVCNVADNEDGPSSFPATLAAMTGPDGATGVGSQEASCSYTDQGGLTAASSLSYSITDATAPGVGYTLTPTTPDGFNGWYRSAVSLVWTVAEADSPSTLSKVGCVDAVITLDQLPGDYSCSATSSGGGPTGPVTVSIKKDGTAPDVALTDVAGTAGNAGWYTSDVTATFTATDATSGPASATGSATSNGEGSAVAVPSPEFTDNAGNVAAAGALTPTFKIDKTAPDVALTDTSGTAGNGDWYTSDVIATFTGTDATSGPASATGSVTSSGEGSAVAVPSPEFTDNAGNVTAAGAVTPTFKIDKTAPDVALTDTSGTAGNAGWYTSDVTATFTATDATSGPASATGSVTSSGEGSAVAVPSPEFSDNAGNVTAAGAVTPTFKIDKTAPAVAYTSASGTEGANGWYTSDVDVLFTGTDEASGLSSDTQWATSSGEGPAVSVQSPWFEDIAGNVTPAGADSRTFKIDKGNPTAAFNSTLGNAYFGSVGSVPTCTASDDVSGPAGCVVTGYSTQVGTHTLTATAMDNAGRTATAQQSYTVMAWTLKGFYQPIDMGGVLNTVKGGSTVPAKFEVFAGATELTDTSLVSLNAAKIKCTLEFLDDIELTASGNTSLRYDATGGQFIYNWKTPATPGSCYKLTMTAADGSSISANFKLK
ncbi:PxKF domain-containing protein [Arthrobacter sp. CJ23]|uniref:PxKF domain-containing protein n=1 Tax=Arthrobacter sp. CJ23 TaxID=2972479 RepID=UPI00215CC584|nr:PxKF domain-containing protein [Arthrobacter sp. CJ23]UVJ39277.1 PxKF domain-containing protein [Arthrobacter sp. CJ23]